MAVVGWVMSGLGIAGILLGLLLLTGCRTMQPPRWRIAWDHVTAFFLTSKPADPDAAEVSPVDPPGPLVVTNVTNGEPGPPALPLGTNTPTPPGSTPIPPNDSGISPPGWDPTDIPPGAGGIGR